MTPSPISPWVGGGTEPLGGMFLGESRPNLFLRTLLLLWSSCNKAFAAASCCPPSSALSAGTVVACGEGILKVLDVCANAVWPGTSALRSRRICHIQIAPAFRDPLLSLWRTLLEGSWSSGPRRAGRWGWGAGAGSGSPGGVRGEGTRRTSPLMWEPGHLWDRGSLACWRQVPLSSQKDKACCLVMGTDLSRINASGPLG